MSERRYFGTDGIRGAVGEPPISADFMLKVGWAVGRVLGRGQHGRRPSALIGKDTRLSGYMFESALEAGLAAAGCDILLVGPMPTPGIAYLTRTFDADVGIVISASHNPFDDNGVKFFSPAGEKLPDATEAAIEAALDDAFETASATELGRARRIDDAAGRYIEYCKGTLSRSISLRGMHLAIDCANGATYHVAPRVFSELGAKVTPIANRPDGMNINDGCGATDLTTLKRAVAENQADLGIAFDGDGDRVMMVSPSGVVLDGDAMLYILARHRIGRGDGDKHVVGTVMSNYGLGQAFESLGLTLERAPVGDRHVGARMRELDAKLGGESSGHLILRDKSTTGDGIVSALEVLEALVSSGLSADDALRGFDRAPQVMINVPVVQSVDLATNEPINAAVREVEAQLNGRGRVILRASGTEPVIRVTVEGAPELPINELAESLAETVAKTCQGAGL